MMLFSWIGKLFLSSAEDAAGQVLKDEINKVHDDIATSIAPILSQIPADQREKMIPQLTDVAKQAAVAYAEAYLNAYIPKIAVTPVPPISTVTPGQ